MAWTISSALFVAATPSAALDLVWPVGCILGETCHIQQYPDHDPGSGALDFTCGPLSYDGHIGTDIALPNRTAMAQGVTVLAAAPGTVNRVRDNMGDFAPVEPGKECGNGVLIDHGEGWTTQYCHLRQGSVRVRPGDEVAAGQELGLIGQSGWSTFPHLDFTVRLDGKVVDPFASDAPACGEPTAKDLWEDTPEYQPGGFLASGFSPFMPGRLAISVGLRTRPISSAAPTLVLWAHLFGLRPGDGLLFAIIGPSGALLEETVSIDRHEAQGFRAIGMGRPASEWPAGTYQGEIRLIRDGREIDMVTTSILILP